IKEKKNIREAYFKIQKIFEADTVNKEDVDQVARDYNYRIMISDPINQMVYSSEGEQGVMYKDLKNILQNIDKIQSQLNEQGFAVTTNTSQNQGTSINLTGYLDGQYTVIINTPMESIQTSGTLSGRFTAY